MKVDHDIIIAGGGLVGMAFALVAAKENFRVLVADDSPAAINRVFDGRAFALTLSSCRLLGSLGMSDFLRTKCQEIRAIRISEGSAYGGADPVALGFDSAEIETGPMGLMVEDRHLHATLRQCVESCTDRIRWLSRRLTEVKLEDFCVKATDSHGNLHAARMIVGCDGRDSLVARAAGMTWNEKEYHQSGLVCAVRHEKPHEGIARQFFMPSGPLAILPLTGNRSSLVWTMHHPEGKRLASLGDDDFLRALRAPFGDCLGDISLIGTRASFPLTLSLATHLVAPRAALLGDSAHGLHPLAGQNLNLGLRDVASLAEILGTAARRGEDIGAINVMERFQRWRRFDIAAFAVVTDGFNWLFSNADPTLRMLRTGGMAALQRLPAVRRSIIRAAAGLHADLPKAMEGQSF
ncbi:MAG: FAD-dependent monooxygenase [Rhodobacteraceae bacterium]|nr:FAD-dependent monooxygenase [Paracoccaceae bacterium]MCY4196268.1 FAD-dependent monooxygenase [Paracoccaceae bacterium]MCY4327568.1 FAD-dependent monooxygenase [Paracoccaceae bacterium]